MRGPHTMFQTSTAKPHNPSFPSSNILVVLSNSRPFSRSSSSIADARSSKEGDENHGSNLLRAAAAEGLQENRRKLEQFNLPNLSVDHRDAASSPKTSPAKKIKRKIPHDIVAFTVLRRSDRVANFPGAEYREVSFFASVSQLLIWIFCC